MRDEISVEQSLQRQADFVTTHAERSSHAFTAKERDAASVGCECQQHERRRRVRSDLGEPSVM